MDPLTILTAFIPLVSDGVRGVINKFTGGAGAEPANTEEAIQLMDADIRRLEALSKLDTPGGNVSGWVSNVRAMQRPAATGLILINYMVTVLADVDPGYVDMSANLASAVVFYLFGDRTYMKFKRNGGK